MNDKKLWQLKKEYLETPIPAELDFVVKKTLKESEKSMKKSLIKIKKLRITVASLVAAFAILFIAVNTSPVIAQAMIKVPVFGSFVKVITIKEYKVDDNTFNANIKVPALTGFENKEFESSLNEKYLKENEELYKEFQATMEEMKKNDGGHLGVDSGFVIKTDNEKILSIGRYVVNIVASSSTEFKYDTIDKQKEILLTLPSLFVDDTYINIISKYIKEQMLAENKADENKIYWVEGIGEEIPFEAFEKISAEQNFYINPEHKLVISFDKYEVAPGYMGVIEFEIPTAILSGVLVGNEYIIRDTK